MQKWENSVLEINRRESGNIKYYLDMFGKQGFELVAVAHGLEFHYYYFKRPFQEEIIPEKPGDETLVIVSKQMTEEEKKKDIDSILQKTEELTPAYKNKQHEKRRKENQS